MRNAFVLARRELRSSLNSPVAYSVALFFLLFASIWLFYVQRFFSMGSSSLRSYFSAFPVALVIIAPALTMRGWAEEYKLGTAELLLTLPFTEWELTAGKFLSAFGLLMIIYALTLPVPIFVAPLGVLDLGEIVGEYLGAVLLGSAAISIGLFASSLAKNQVSAFLAGVSILGAATFANRITESFALPIGIADAVNALSFAYRFGSFARGVIDTRDAAYFVSVSALFLYLNTRVIIFRKWS